MIEVAARRFRHLLAHEVKGKRLITSGPTNSHNRRESYSRQEQGKRSTVVNRSSIKCSGGRRSSIKYRERRRSSIKCSGRRKKIIKCTGRRRCIVKKESISSYIKQRFNTDSDTEKNRIACLEEELAKLRESNQKAIMKSWEEAERVRQENGRMKAENDDLVKKCQELERKVEDLQRQPKVGNTTGNSPALTNNKEDSHKRRQKVSRFNLSPLTTVRETRKIPCHNPAVSAWVSSPTSVEDISSEESERKSRGLPKNLTVHSLSTKVATTLPIQTSTVLVDFSLQSSVDDISSQMSSQEPPRQQQQQNESFLSALSKNTKDIISSGIQNSRMLHFDLSNNNLENIAKKEQQVEELQCMVDKQQITIDDLTMEVNEIVAEKIAFKKTIKCQKDSIVDLENWLTEMQSKRNQVVKQHENGYSNNDNNNDQIIEELQDRVLVLETRNKEKEKEIERIAADYYYQWKKSSAIGMQENHSKAFDKIKM